jgi:hypothetical protein
MRRFIVLLLLWILPIQFGLVGTIDALEYSRVGHSEFSHSHPHAASTADTSANAALDNDADPSVRSHGECGACHFHHSLAFFGQSHRDASPVVASDKPSADHCHSPNDFTGHRPDRPQWLLLA